MSQEPRDQVTCSTAIGLLLVAVLAASSLSQESGKQDDLNAGAIRHFEQTIRPTLTGECIQCHGSKKQEGELRLDSLAAILKGGDSGPALVVGSPEQSLLLEAIRYESFEMPPTHQLSATIADAFEVWITTGASWPEEHANLRAETGQITEADRQWWAFQPVIKPAIPNFPDDNWSINAIDKFVGEKLSEKGMVPAPAATPETLLRRLYFDVIGVPPSPQEIDAFSSDPSDKAWEQLVDKLLDDPRYGEHWARHWLDLVRYSESDGWNQDAYRPNIWRYRDYVVDALNDDKPYPEFVREQLAGDEIQEDNPEHLVATGFLRLGIYEYNQRDARGHWNDIMNEMTDVAGDVFLGMSVACARCHDHKFDPIPQTDYFKLRAFFEPISWRDDLVAATEQRKQEYEQKLNVWREATASVRAQIDALLEPYYAKKWLSTVDKFPMDIQACFHMPIAERTSWQNQMAYLVSRQFLEEGGGPLKNMKKEDEKRHEALKNELAKFDSIKPGELPAVMAATDFDGLASPTRIPEAPSVAVTPGFLSVITPSERDQNSNAPHAPSNALALSGKRRTALAKWIGSADNPLTTRVIVNRVWQQHFGQGLVPTSSDFGTQGQQPSHPELLDWLTKTFIDAGWSLKQLHKEILLSAAWRQSASHPAAARYQELDPADALLWRSRVRRLHAEQIRDSMLCASGQLDPTVGGPSVEEMEPRRALYVKSFRNKYDTFLHGFDMANGLKSIAVRDTTTTPTQSLLLFNGKYALAQAKAMSERLLKEFPHDQRGAPLIKQAFLLAWGRQPTLDETEEASAFLTANDPTSEEYATQVEDFCHVLFNSNQFLYVE